MSFPIATTLCCAEEYPKCFVITLECGCVLCQPCLVKSVGRNLNMSCPVCRKDARASIVRELGLGDRWDKSVIGFLHRMYLSMR